MDHVVTIFVYAVQNPTFYGRHLQTPDFVLKRARWNTQIVLKDRYLRLSAVRCPLSAVGCPLSAVRCPTVRCG